MNFRTFFEDYDQHKSASIIVTDNSNNILILYRSSWLEWAPNKWGLPGGSIEEEENHQDAAERECYEETQIKPFNVKFFKSYDLDETKLYVYTGECGDQKPKLNNEHRDYEWISINEIDDYEFAPNVKQILLNYFARLNSI